MFIRACPNITAYTCWWGKSSLRHSLGPAHSSNSEFHCILAQFQAFDVALWSESASFFAHCPTSSSSLQRVDVSLLSSPDSNGKISFSVKLPCWAAQAQKPVSSAPCTVALNTLHSNSKLTGAFPKITQHAPRVPSHVPGQPAAEVSHRRPRAPSQEPLTCCTDFAPTGSVQCPKLPSPCRFVRFQRLFRLRTSIFRLQPEVLLKWAEPHCTQEAGPFSSVAQDSLLGPIIDWQLSSFLVLPETVLLHLLLFQRAVLLAGYLRRHPSPYESSSPSMSSYSSLHSFPVSKTSSPLLDSPSSRLGPVGFEFPRSPARSKQSQHREGNLLLVVATLRFA